MEKMINEIMPFSERLQFANVLSDWRYAQMQQIGLQVKDKERLTAYYLDCIALLMGLGIIDIKKAREFIKSMEAGKCIS